MYRCIRVLYRRGALDPKAFYKKLDSTKFPKYFQMGTVVEGAADFYSGGCCCCWATSFCRREGWVPGGAS
jgi:hypothetical protein